MSTQSIFGRIAQVAKAKIAEAQSRVIGAVESIDIMDPTSELEARLAALTTCGRPAALSDTT
jgi:hypothetical protein